MKARPGAGRRWANSCARRAPASRRRWPGCRPARGAARRACGAKKWRSSPTSASPGTPGSSRAAKSPYRPRYGRVSPMSCTWRAPSAPICSSWPNAPTRSSRATRAAMRPCRCRPVSMPSTRQPTHWTAPGTCWPATPPCASCSTTGRCATRSPTCCATSSWTRPRASWWSIGTSAPAAWWPNFAPTRGPTSTRPTWSRCSTNSTAPARSSRIGGRATPWSSARAACALKLVMLLPS
ncbi:Uncharacterised protein [Bordetella pertussis]|nr:Uncharacterised protein [Bordetella pertussis]